MLHLDAIVSIRDHLANKVRSAASPAWASSGGHTALLQMALSLQQFAAANLTITGTVTAGSVRAVGTDGEVLMDLSWNAIRADTEIAAERVMNGRRQS